MRKDYIRFPARMKQLVSFTGMTIENKGIQKQNGTYESNANPFGICGTCGCELEPSYFVEEEEIIQHGVRFKTGRVRRAVDCLVCPNCLRTECVDDSFDGPWMDKAQWKKLHGLH